MRQKYWRRTALPSDRNKRAVSYRHRSFHASDAMEETMTEEAVEVKTVKDEPLQAAVAEAMDMLKKKEEKAAAPAKKKEEKKTEASARKKEETKTVPVTEEKTKKEIRKEEKAEKKETRRRMKEKEIEDYITTPHTSWIEKLIDPLKAVEYEVRVRNQTVASVLNGLIWMSLKWFLIWYFVIHSLCSVIADKEFSVERLSFDQQILMVVFMAVYFIFAECILTLLLRLVSGKMPFFKVFAADTISAMHVVILMVIAVIIFTKSQHLGIALGLASLFIAVGLRFYALTRVIDHRTMLTYWLILIAMGITAYYGWTWFLKYCDPLIELMKTLLGI